MRADLAVLTVTVAAFLATWWPHLTAPELDTRRIARSITCAFLLAAALVAALLIGVLR